MITPQNNGSNSSSQILIEPRKEVRFAVVLYGGVSLAVYINGVTQELFRMVRATAPAGIDGDRRTALSGAQGTSPNNSLIGTERVYRKLSHLLSDEELLVRLRKQADAVEKEKDEEKAKTLAAELTADLEKLATDNTRVIGTTFIVDILSGTSAGGINAIYLAKALANDQRIDRLKQLWISESDIELLLNDKRSLEGIHLEAQDPPISLLNSRRMYLKLLRAFDDMDHDNAPVEDALSPYSKELDLYITATDLEGVPVPLKLADKIVFERRHRNVFRFEYQEAERVNDFLAESNPFLAFAARCTSSFPFAFEPMRLSDIDEVLDLLPEYRDKTDCKSDSPRWRRYFREILDPETGVPNLRFTQRSFGDGGVLDNKPFTHAIEALVRRQSEVPVDRRLIYVEPSPEHPEDVPERNHKPDALKNVKSALLDLPAVETIREDLQKVLQRNLLIDRVQRITSSIEKEINKSLIGQFAERLAAFPALLAQTPQTMVLDQDREMWEQRNLTAMIKEKGRSFLSYRKLRISAVTNDIARLLGRLLNFDADSDLLLAMRCLARVWRDSQYFEDRQPTLNQFLTDYDLGYRLRRLNFIRERIDRLYNYDRIVQAELKEFGEKYPDLEGQIDKLDHQQLRLFRHINADIGWLLGLFRSSQGLSNLKAEQLAELRDVLIFMKCEVNEVYKDMQQAARKLRLRRSQQKHDGSPDSVNPLLEEFEKIGLKTEHLKAIMNSEDLENLLNGKPASSNTDTRSEDDCLLAARKFLDENLTDRNVVLRLNEAAQQLKKELHKIADRARRRIGVLLNPSKLFEPESERGKKFMKGIDQTEWINKKIVKVVREHLAYYYYNFEEYDQISFPIFYQADVGEASMVEVIRISPEDATELIDERKERRESADGKGRRKLAGDALHHFGAFLDRSWRQNDIMWGRLDGFERIVAAMLPGKQNESLRKVLIKEGHTSILIDELPPESRLQLGSLVSEALVRTSAGEPIDAAVSRVTRELNTSPVRTRLEAIIRASLDNQELLDFIKTGYEVNRKLDPRPLLASISRSTQIIGRVFESIANSNQLDGSSLKWIARLGQIFWGFVEVAVPNSIRNLLWNRWLSVLYAFEVFTIVAGILVSSNGAQRFGWTALGITAVLNVVVLILKDIMQGRRAVLRTTGVIASIFILLLAAVGFIEVIGPIFGVRWGPGNGLYPMTWLKDTVKEVVPFRSDIGRRRFFDVSILVSVTALIVLVNAIFGLVDFTWLDLRWNLFRTWWKQSKYHGYIPWRRFKPIQIIATDLERKTKVFPGKQDLLILPFSFSTLPPAAWVRHFELNFKQQQNDPMAAQQMAVSNKEIVVVSASARLSSVFPGLSAAAEAANQKHRSDLSEKARKDYESQKLLVQMKSRAPVVPPTTVLESVSSELRAISQIAVQNAGRWANWNGRILGVLTISLAALIILSLASNLYTRYQRPEIRLPGGVSAPVLALELAHNPGEANLAIETAGWAPDKSQPERIAAGRALLTQAIVVDWFVILGYVIILGWLCLWLGVQSPIGRWFTIAAGLSVLAGAVFDVLENNRMVEVLNQEPITAAAVDRVLLAGSLKWAFLFLMLIFIGRKFWTMSRSGIKWLGMYLIVTAMVGAVGLLAFRIGVEVAFWMMAVGLLIVGVVLLLAPNRFRKELSTS